MRYFSVVITILSVLLSGVAHADSISIDDLVERNNLFYKKFTDEPYSGSISGIESGKFNKGLREGLWKEYYDNGQLKAKGDYKKGVHEGPWVFYDKLGKLIAKGNKKMV